MQIPSIPVFLTMAGTRPNNVQKWNFTAIGRVTSSPAVVNGVVYVGQWSPGSGIGDGMVYALSAFDDETLEFHYG